MTGYQNNQGVAGLPMFANTRNTDPETSHDAAASITPEKLRASQLAVLRVFQGDAATGGEGLTDSAMMVRYVDAHDLHGPHVYPLQSPSGLRTRRRELADLGLVYDTGATEALDSGRKSIVWRART